MADSIYAEGNEALTPLHDLIQIKNNIVRRLYVVDEINNQE